MVPGLPMQGMAPRPLPVQEGFPRKADFSIPEGVTYINGAYMHPMPNVVRAAVHD